MIRNVLLLVGICLLFFHQGWAETIVPPRLSPLPADVEKQKVSLCGQWLFNPSPADEFWKKEVDGWKNIEVPGEWTMQGFEVEKGKTAGYYRMFTIPLSWKGQRIKLRCNGIYSDARIYINGQKAGAHLGGFTAFETDITPLVEFGADNRIFAAVNSESVADGTSNASRYAVHPLGGITRDIYLFALPEVSLSMFHAATLFDDTYTDAVLRTEVSITNEASNNSGDLSLHFALKDAEGKVVPLESVVHDVRSIASGATENRTISFQVAKPVKWDSEHPYLYTLTCSLKDKEQVLHTTTRRIGFRQVEVRGNQMYINNYPIKLRGVCRHEVMPLRGRSVNDDMWRKDVELFRRGNVNYIRTSHYPPDEALLEACDELGMLVEVEAPFCWAHETKVPEDKFKAILVNQHVEMVNLNRTHPSVIMWSLGNESNLFTEYFSQAAEIIKQLDSTRPRIFSQWGPDADGGALEVTNHHYPGPGGPEMYRNSKRPVVFDEFCHLNAYNRLELAADPGLRDMWGALLDAMWNDMYNSRGVLGGAIWAGIDDTFFLPGEKAVGYGTWGPIDGWRREKPEFWNMKKAFSPVRIKQQGNMSENGKIGFRVENRHNFSNLSECKLVWKAGEQEGQVVVNIAPRSEGTFEIELPESLRNTETLELTVTGARGFVVDEYLFRILPAIVEQPQKQSRGHLDCQEKEEAIEVRMNDCRFMISKRNGLFSGVSKGKTVIQTSPTLMVLPLNGYGEGIQMTGKDQKFNPFNPVCVNWIAESVTCTQTKNVVCIQVKGGYKEASGILEYRFYATGELTIAYDFTMLQAISPRQVGLVFTLPASFSSLNWKRKGYWNVYPKEHIGALEGRAEIFNPALPVSGLAGPSKPPTVAWGFDQTAAGSNLFRSTKENIYAASLVGPDGTTISVQSDGTQHLRAWKEGEYIRLLIADYNNAGSENFLYSHAEKGYKPLRRGDQIKGIIRLNL